MSDDRRWAAVQTRDKTQDGQFLVGVLTTGVYCRPSCPARLPKRKNVRFYTTSKAAEADGLRACRRCRPLANIGRDPTAAIVGMICRYLESHADQRVSLNDLAALAVMSPWHLQRSFKLITGVSPKAYQANVRLAKFKVALRTEPGVTDAIHLAGYGSSSRMYEKVDTALGMTPQQYRNGGDGAAITYAFAKTPVGLLLMGATERGICFVQFAETRAALEARLADEYPNAHISAMPEPPSDHFERWIDALTQHLTGNLPHLDLPLDVRGTAFQLKVWRYLQSIPYGAVQPASPDRSRSRSTVCPARHAPDSHRSGGVALALAYLGADPRETTDVRSTFQRKRLVSSDWPDGERELTKKRDLASGDRRASNPKTSGDSAVRKSIGALHAVPFRNAMKRSLAFGGVGGRPDEKMMKASSGDTAGS